MTELLEVSKPPDPELVDLIERAFLAGQIDGHKADLAYWWLRQHESAAYFARNGAKFSSACVEIMWAFLWDARFGRGNYLKHFNRLH